MSETTLKHREAAPKKIRFGILIISSSRYSKFLKNQEVEDETGKLLIKEINKERHVVSFYTLLPDHRKLIQAFVEYACEELEFDSLIASGGTGVSLKDVTIEALREIAKKELKGFGEVFRDESKKKIGEAVILTRASAFIVKDKLIYVIPGSPDAARIALPIILNETGHILYHLKE